MHKPPITHSFEDNPFLQDCLDWIGSPEGQRSVAVSDALWELMADVQLDAPRRRLIWPEGDHLSLGQSITYVQQQDPSLPRPRIESFLVSWVENYVPEGYSEIQLDALDRLTEQWLADLGYRSKLL